MSEECRLKHRECRQHVIASYPDERRQLKTCLEWAEVILQEGNAKKVLEEYSLHFQAPKDFISFCLEDDLSKNCVLCREMFVQFFQRVDEKCEKSF